MKNNRPNIWTYQNNAYICEVIINQQLKTSQNGKCIQS